MDDRVKERVPYVTVAETLADLKAFVPPAIYKRAFCGPNWGHVEAAVDKKLDDLTEIGGTFKDLIVMYLTNIVVDNLRMELVLGQRAEVDEMGYGIGMADLTLDEKTEIRATLDAMGKFLGGFLGIAGEFIIAYPEEDDLGGELKTVRDVIDELGRIVPKSMWGTYFDNQFWLQIKDLLDLDLDTQVSVRGDVMRMRDVIRRELVYSAAYELQEVWYKPEPELTNGDRELMTVQRAVLAFVERLAEEVDEDDVAELDEPEVQPFKLTHVIETDDLERVDLPESTITELWRLIREGIALFEIDGIDAHFRIFSVTRDTQVMVEERPCFMVSGLVTAVVACEGCEDLMEIPVNNLLVPFENVMLKAKKNEVN